MIKYAALLLTVFAVLSCQTKQEDNRDLSDCLYAVPEAIFPEGTNAISDHHFSYDGAAGKEDLSFDEDGVRLHIIQSGCDHLKQEFRFQLPGARIPGTPGQVIALAVRQFERIAGLGPEFLVFEEWAEAIEAQSDEIGTGEPTALQPGFYVKVETEGTQKDAILVITLSDRP